MDRKKELTDYTRLNQMDSEDIDFSEIPELTEDDFERALGCRQRKAKQSVRTGPEPDQA